MKIHIREVVYRRCLDVAAHQNNRPIGDLIEEALVRFLGLEGVPLDDDRVFGVKHERNEK